MISGLEPWLQPYTRALLSYFPQLIMTSGYRSPTKQLELWNNRHRNPYPVAPPGTSYHEYGRAFDVVGPPDVLAAAGRVWEAWGGTWGGRFRRDDPIHFQA